MVVGVGQLQWGPAVGERLNSMGKWEFTAKEQGQWMENS